MLYNANTKVPTPVEWIQKSARSLEFAPPLRCKLRLHWKTLGMFASLCGVAPIRARDNIKSVSYTHLTLPTKLEV